jgi:sugar diacid utilization regulator
MASSRGKARTRPSPVRADAPGARLASAHAEAVQVIAHRIAERKEELAQEIVDRFREEILDYRMVEDHQWVFDDVLGFALDALESLLSSLESGGPLSEELLQRTREVAARSVHHGVSLESFLHASRLWGQTIWNSVLAAARTDRPREREAALEIASRIWRHVDVIATAAGNAYLDEITDRGLLARDLLDALLSGTSASERVQRLARIAHLRLAENYVVVVVRGDLVPTEAARAPSLATRVALDRIVHATRTHLRPTAGSLVVGMHQRDLIALYPLSDSADIATVKQDCTALADAITVDVSVGMSGWHAGLAAVGTAYTEAKEAVEIAESRGIRRRAVALDDVLIDHMLRSSPYARRILDETLRPLVEYDRARQAELVPTLRAYVNGGTNITRSAEMLTVHPNTVVYRLHRIKDLSGRDPHDVNDLVILFMALKLTELRSERE